MAFELIVVGDGCSDDTAQWVGSLGSTKVRWVNLRERCGSQSFPNNSGIELARGKYIAYLGHDDIWAPNHLSSLAKAFAANPDCSFAISGLISHGPEGSGIFMADGLFEKDGAQFSHFFPPSCLSHSKQVWQAIGPWLPPAQLRLPVDCDFQWRAAQAGHRFCATHTITAHKFPAVDRYLSYLLPSSGEQEAVLAILLGPRGEAYAQACMAKAKASNQVMKLAMPDEKELQPGELYTIASELRGLSRPKLIALTQTEIIRQNDDRRSYDWYPLERLGPKGYRWSGPNPYPKILLPYTCAGQVEMLFEIAYRVSGYFADVVIEVNGQAVAWRTLGQSDQGFWLQIFCPLRVGAASTIAFKGRTAAADSVTGNGDQRRIGMLMGDILLRPAIPAQESPAAWPHPPA